ncbi:hypothetical protein [Lentibacillus populi]|uniref:hypothetical protein n=1 Tax=Lentibacillus populi TaxID=1827502 RepID=UPI00166D94DD|nr:hypothetical protein [Lentibacillus populi]
MEMEQLSFDSLLLECDSAEKAHTTTENSKIKIKAIKENRKVFPSSLVIDFDRFMNYAEHQSIQLGSSGKCISAEHLPAINERFIEHQKDITNNKHQEQYPYIHLFYYLASSGKLLKKTSNPLNKRQLQVTERWNMYQRLTDTEKYLFLLETFWVDTNWAKLLNQPINFVHFLLPDLLTKLIESKTRNFLLNEDSLLTNLITEWNYFFLYLEWFGIWVCETNEQTRHDYFPKQITLTIFGKNVAPILLKSRNLGKWNIALRCEYGEVDPIPGSSFPDFPNDKFPIKSNNRDHRPQHFYEAFTHLFPKRDLQTTLP